MKAFLFSVFAVIWGSFVRLPISDAVLLLSGVRSFAVTAPLLLDRYALIGVYAEGLDSGFVCEVPLADLPEVYDFLYTPVRVPVYVHGFKRIWENPNSSSHMDACVLRFVGDARLMAYLLDPDSGEGNGLSLPHLSHRYLGEEYPYRIVDIYNSASESAFDEILAYDAHLIYRLGRVLPKLMDSQLLKLYRDVELPLMALLHRMHVDGIGVDGNAAQSQLKETDATLAELEKEITGGARVNLSSDRELKKFLHASGVPILSQSEKSRQAGDTDYLEVLAPSYPLVRKVLEWQSLSRDRNFLESACGKNRLHATWGQTRASTSRIHAHDPALQNVRRGLRHLFIPAPGCELIKADYSQAQMRILAHLSQDENLIALFREGKKPHKETQEWLKLDYDSAKQVNFGICFGMSAASLAAKINSIRAERHRDSPSEEPVAKIDEKVAQGYIDGFYARYPRVKEFFNREWSALKKQRQRDRVVKSLLGRIRRFDVHATPKVERQFRVTWPQQIEADMLKNAAVRLDRVFHRRGMQSRIVMLIHDSLWVEAPKAEVEQAKHLMRRMMTTALKFAVPLEVDFS